MTERTPDSTITQPVTAGIDIGGTKVETAVVDAEGRVLGSHRHPTNAQKGPENVLPDIVECYRQCLPDHPVEVVAAGVGVAGPVDRERGVLISSANLKWSDVPLRDELEEQLGVPVVVGNDVDAATLGEWHHGAGKDEEYFACVFIGTGVGTGVISGGRLVEGCVSPALEFGHTTLVEEGRDCSCRNRGCLEAYVGGWAIGERAREAAREDPEAGKTLREMAGSVEEITSRHVSEAFENDDPLAVELVEQTGRYLGGGLVSFVNTFHPCGLVLGGGVIEGIPELIPLATRQIEQRTLEVYAENLEVRTPSLGEKAPVIGAAVMARRDTQPERG